MIEEILSYILSHLRDIYSKIIILTRKNTM